MGNDRASGSDDTLNAKESHLIQSHSAKDTTAASKLKGSMGDAAESALAEIVGPNDRANKEANDGLRQNSIQEAEIVVLNATPEADDYFRNLAADGGSVGSVILGVWSILGSLLTYYSFINALLAIALGFFGMGSTKKRMALFGILLGFIGLVFSLMEINEILSDSWSSNAESGSGF